MQELKITMLGPSGIGKTSLLTAMWDQFTDTIGLKTLQLIPDTDSLQKNSRLPCRTEKSCESE